jgi:hypothetical protein
MLDIAEPLWSDRSDGAANISPDVIKARVQSLHTWMPAAVGSAHTCRADRQ